ETDNMMAMAPCTTEPLVPLVVPFPGTKLNGTVDSSVQFAAQPSPPNVLHLMHFPPGHVASLVQAVNSFVPPTHTPSPSHWLSEVHTAPALVPPMQIPPSSHSSLTSVIPLPQIADEPLQPLSALLTARMMKSTVTGGLPLGSPAGHADSSRPP